MEESSIQLRNVTIPDRYSSHDIKSFLNCLKVMRGRKHFLKLKEIAATVPLESAIIPGEDVSFQDIIKEILNRLIQHLITINENHCYILYGLNEQHKLSNGNNDHLMFVNKKKILDFAYQISSEINKEKQHILNYIKKNRNWCSVKSEFDVTLKTNTELIQDKLNNTYYRKKKELEIKKQKKLRLIKTASEITWSIMSSYPVDYRKTDFKNVLLRINGFKQLTLGSLSTCREIS